jgi:uroporphyrin-III C-methyltransferase
MTVYLVGAGPGDPGLITARGLELVRRCDALVYDTLVAPELVAEASDEALLVPRAGLDQEAINGLLVELGHDGLETVRLKGGDPFVFGRGGEEAITLAEAGVAFEVVPGVSALASVPAAFDIPVTHRGVAAQVTLVSGHSGTGDELDFAQLARTPGTLVFFMGLRQVDTIVERLLAHGRAPDTPAAVLARGTLADGELVEGELRELPELAQDLPQPALVVIGEVVALRRALATPVAATA